MGPQGFGNFRRLISLKTVEVSRFWRMRGSSLASTWLCASNPGNPIPHIVLSGWGHSSKHFRHGAWLPSCWDLLKSKGRGPHSHPYDLVSRSIHQGSCSFINKTSLLLFLKSLCNKKQSSMPFGSLREQLHRVHNLLHFSGLHGDGGAISSIHIWMSAEFTLPETWTETQLSFKTHTFLLWE